MYQNYGKTILNIANCYTNAWCLKMPSKKKLRKFWNEKARAQLLSGVVVALMVISAFTGLFLMSERASADSPTTWYNSSWSYCKEIWIQSSHVDTALTDYPILIYIASDSDLASDAQDDGDDILFALDDGTKLSHEIEKFDGSTGELWAWVKIPSLSATSNTSIFMYYGNSGATNQENVADVWSNGYEAVWHFNEASGNIIDRTGNGYNGAVVGTPNYHQSGKVGYAIQLDESSSEYFTLPSFGTLFSGTNDFTIMALYKSTSDSDGLGNASFYDYADYYVSLIHRYDLDGYPTRFYTKQGGTVQSVDTTTSHPLNVWWADTAVYDADAGLKIYTNGSYEASNNNYGSFDSNSEANNTIGASLSTTYPRCFGGYLDEMRIYSRIPSDGEISTTYNFMNDPVGGIVVGAEETNGPSLPSAPTGATATAYTKFDITLSGYNGNSKFNFSTFSTNDTAGDTTWSNSTTYGIAKITNAGVQQINLSWIKGTGATNTYIEWNTVSSWSRGAGTLLYNSTGTSATLTDVPAGATRYFELWSWNASGFSSTYATASATAGNASVTNLTIHMEDGGTGTALLPKENITLYGNGTGSFALLGSFDATTGNITLTTSYAGLPLAIGDTLYFEFKSVIGPGAQPNGTYYDKNAETLDCYVYAWR